VRKNADPQRPPQRNQAAKLQPSHLTRSQCVIYWPGSTGILAQRPF